MQKKLKGRMMIAACDLDHHAHPYRISVSKCPLFATSVNIEACGRTALFVLAIWYIFLCLHYFTNFPIFLPSSYLLHVAMYTNFRKFVFFCFFLFTFILTFYLLLFVTKGSKKHHFCIFNVNG